MEGMKLDDSKTGALTVHVEHLRESCRDLKVDNGMLAEGLRQARADLQLVNTQIAVLAERVDRHRTDIDSNKEAVKTSTAVTTTNKVQISRNLGVAFGLTTALNIALALWRAFGG